MTKHCWVISWYNGDHVPRVEQYVYLGDTPKGGVYVQYAGNRKAIRTSSTTIICRTEDELRAALEPLLLEREQRAEKLLHSLREAREKGPHVHVQRSEPWPKVKIDLGYLED